MSPERYESRPSEEQHMQIARQDAISGPDAPSRGRANEWLANALFLFPLSFSAGPVLQKPLGRSLWAVLQ